MAKLPPPPGRRLVNQMRTRTKWRLLTPLGLLLVGVGLWVLIEAGWARHTGAFFRQWFLWGVYGLILFYGGLLLLGQALRFRVRLDYRRFVRRKLRKRDRGWIRRKRKTSPRRGEAGSKGTG